MNHDDDDVLLVKEVVELLSGIMYRSWASRLITQVSPRPTNASSELELEEDY